MKIVWIRHGVTNLNEEGRYLGHFDEPMNDNGKRQVRELAKQLTFDDIDGIYASDLTRTRETAEIIANQYGKTPFITKKLRELDFGDWDKKNYQEIMNQNPKSATSWYDDPFTQQPPNGESIIDLGKRVDEFLENLSSNENKLILVITHGGPIRWFQSKWIDQDIHRFWKVTGCLHGNGFISVREGEKWAIDTKNLI